MTATHNKANENFISMAPFFFKGSDNIISRAPTYGKANLMVGTIGPDYDKGESGNLSVGQNYKCENNTISFGGFNEEPVPNPTGGSISGYDLLMNAQSTAQTLEACGQKDPVEIKMGSNMNAVAKANSTPDTIQKNKEPNTAKKATPNNFPSNVKSLLSTGIFDGFPVKYVSWSMEKSQWNYKGD